MLTKLWTIIKPLIDWLLTISQHLIYNIWTTYDPLVNQIIASN
jgi:hypothetical protein